MAAGTAQSGTGGVSRPATADLIVAVLAATGLSCTIVRTLVSPALPTIAGPPCR